MKSLKICYVSSEVVPFAKTGGLADVAGALPIALKDLGQDVRLMMANYKSINERKFTLREVIRLKEVHVNLGQETKVVDGKTARRPGRCSVRVHPGSQEATAPKAPAYLLGQRRSSRSGALPRAAHLLSSAAP